MSGRRPVAANPRLNAPAHTTAPLLLGVELVRGDVAPVLGLALDDVPCGGRVTGALFVDGGLVGRTDEALTDEAAQGGAKRMLGEGVCFQLARPAGGYWLADSAQLGAPRADRGGWSR